MKHGPRLSAPVLVVAVVVVLAGCAAPESPPTHTQTSSAQTPTATPTPTAASAPGSRVPVGCAELLGAANVSALAGANAQVSHDENSAPTNLQAAAQLQYGAEDCVWDGENTGTGSAPGAYLSLDLAPDAKAEFESQFATAMAPTTNNPHPAATEDVAGDESGFWCATDLYGLGADAPSLSCDAEMLVDGYWASIEIGNISGFTRSELTTGLATAMSDIATKLAAAGSAPAQWVALASTPPGFCTDSTSTAIVRTILGDQTLAKVPTGSRSVYAATIGLVGRDGSCSWTSPSDGGLEVEILAGGSWIFPNFAPAPAADDVVGSFSLVTVPGVNSAFLGTGQGSAEAYLEVGTSAVSIVMNDMGAAKNIATLSAFAKAIAAS